jgi:hypothetical protein
MTLAAPLIARLPPWALPPVLRLREGEGDPADRLRRLAFIRITPRYARPMWRLSRWPTSSIGDHNPIGSLIFESVSRHGRKMRLSGPIALPKKTLRLDETNFKYFIFTFFGRAAKLPSAMARSRKGIHVEKGR